MIEIFPLSWPAGFARHNGNKIESKFICTLAQARDGVNNEIARMGGKQVIISSNIPVKANGDLYASMQPVDGDHGVAVYFTWKGDQVVLACDRYKTIRENLRAVEKSIEAMRGLERWGCSDILNRTFSGFKALPGGEVRANRNWYTVLGVKQNSSEAKVKSAYYALVKEYHPDNQVTGNNLNFLEVQQAWEIYKNGIL